MKNHEIKNRNAIGNKTCGSVQGRTADVYAGMSEEDRIHYNKTATLNEDLTLREMRERIGSSKGIAMMTVKALRRQGVLVGGVTCRDCRFELYDNGLAVYRKPHHETVLRMEYVGREFYPGDSEVGMRDEYQDLSDCKWSIAVMCCGDRRMEDEYADRYKRTQISMTGNGFSSDDGEEHDMELDAGIDIAGDYERKVSREEAKEANLSKLRPDMRKTVEMFLFDGKSKSQIAEELGISPRTVRHHLQMAGKILEK